MCSGKGWTNEPQGDLRVECPEGQSITRVASYYIPAQTDRVWTFECEPFPPSNPDVSWECTDFSDDFVHKAEEAMSFQCLGNHFLTGAMSSYSGGDRRWRFKCCRVPGKVTANCLLTGYLNDWFTSVYFYRANRVITGIFSYYKPGS